MDAKKHTPAPLAMSRVDLCQKYGISTKTFNRWLKRSRNNDLANRLKGMMLFMPRDVREIIDAFGHWDELNRPD